MKKSNFINEKCIVRGGRSGVFFGVVKNINEQTVEMENVRRIWYWEGAASLSQLAVEGTKKPQTCKFTMQVPHVIIFDVVEINQCSEQAITSIDGVKEWKL